jgi:hypothetical protein
MQKLDLPKIIPLVLSSLAILISLASLVMSYRNTKRDRQVDTLQRRTNLLIRLTDISQKSIALKVALVDSKRSLSRFESRGETSPIFRIIDHPAVKEALRNPALAEPTEQFLAQLEIGYDTIVKGLAMIPELKDTLSEIERQHQELDEILNRLRSDCDEFDQSTDPREIEKLNPEAHKLEVELARLSDMIRSTLDGPLRNSHEVLDNLESQLRSDLPGLL